MSSMQATPTQASPSAGEAAHPAASRLSALSTEVLNILNSPQALPDALRRLLDALKRGTGLDAVAIRLERGGDYPYWCSDGFSRDFLMAENSLAIRSGLGGVCRDAQGNICLECTCGLVLTGRLDRASPQTTAAGSLWTNDGEAALKIPAAEDPRVNPRNRCIHEGFLSVALIPIRVQGRIVGLLQLNDRRKDCFTRPLVEFFEGIADSFGVTLLRLKEEQQLREAEQKYRGIFENATEGIFQSSPEGALLTANPALAEMLGMPTPEALLSWAQNAEPCCWLEASRRGEFRRLLAGQAPVRGFECQLCRQDGKPVWISIHARIVSQPSETLWLGFVQDVTQRKRAEAETLELNRTLETHVQQRTGELRAANQELDAFSYAVSHDLRAPLRAMSGFSQALLDDFGPALPEAGKNYLQEIQLASQHMSELIDGLLRLSRATRGELKWEPVDLSALAERLLAQLRAAEPQRQVQWLGQPGLVAHGDPRLLEVVLANLLGNAWKYTARTAQACIRLSGRLDEQEVICCIADNGAGFDMQFAGHLFQPFQRLHRQDEFPGTGIGLATVQRIVRRHGGSIKADAAPGRGASFTLRLPHVQTSAPALAAS